MHVLVDFDDTLCPGGVREEAQQAPDPKTLEVLHALVRDGHQITVATSRAYDADRGGWRWRHALRFVRGYLEQHRVPFHDLLLMNAQYDLVIDRRAASPDALAALVGTRQVA